MNLSNELGKALEEAKELENDLDKFIFKEATWESNQSKGVEESIEDHISRLLSELDAIKDKVAEFDDKTIQPVNTKFDDYKSTMETSEKDIPEHIQVLHKKLNDLVDGLKELHGFARDIVQQRHVVEQYMKDGALLEKEAQQVQQVFICLTLQTDSLLYLSFQFLNSASPS